MQDGDKIWDLGRQNRSPGRDGTSSGRTKTFFGLRYIQCLRHPHSPTGVQNEQCQGQERARLTSGLCLLVPGRSAQGTLSAVQARARDTLLYSAPKSTGAWLGDSLTSRNVYVFPDTGHSDRQSTFARRTAGLSSRPKVWTTSCLSPCLQVNQNQNQNWGTMPHLHQGTRHLKAGSRALWADSRSPGHCCSPGLLDLFWVKILAGGII